MSYCLCRECCENRHAEHISQERGDLVNKLVDGLLVEENFRNYIFDKARHDVRAELTKRSAAGDKAGEESLLRRLAEVWVETQLVSYSDLRSMSASEVRDLVRDLCEVAA